MDLKSILKISATLGSFMFISRILILLINYLREIDPAPKTLIPGISSALKFAPESSEIRSLPYLI